MVDISASVKDSLTILAGRSSIEENPIPIAKSTACALVFAGLKLVHKKGVASKGRSLLLASSVPRASCSVRCKTPAAAAHGAARTIE